jgi:capsular polysaccharide biosynthesis protein
MRRPRSKFLAIALRHGWIVILAIAAVTALATVINGSRPGKTETEAVAVVPSGASDEGPGDATQATQLAQTYVEAIPVDGAVIKYIATRIDRTTDEVADKITVVGNPETSVLRLRYEDSETGRALAADEALLHSVTGRHPEARSVAPRSLNVVREPQVLRESAGGSSATIPIGVILGLCLGLVLVVAWERSDPRIDGPDELAHAAGTPATALDDVAPGNIDALLERWRRLAGDGAGPHVVGMVAGTEDTEELVRPAATELARLSAASGQLLRVGSSRPQNGSEQGLVIVTGGVPGGPSAGEAVAADASVVVLTVERGARESELLGTLAVLDQFGARPAWAVLARRQGAS